MYINKRESPYVCLLSAKRYVPVIGKLQNLARICTLTPCRVPYRLNLKFLIIIIIFDFFKSVTDFQLLWQSIMTLIDSNSVSQLFPILKLLVSRTERWPKLRIFCKSSHFIHRFIFLYNSVFHNIFIKNGIL